MGSLLAWPQRARYRVSQVLVGLRPAIEPAEAVEVRRLLRSPEIVLFASMEARDRRHSMDMVRWLQARHPDPPDHLLAACLLHDVGKGRLTLFDRVLFVLLGPLGLRERIASPSGRGLRRRQWTLLEHARLGAERLAAAGVDRRVVSLVERHLDPDPGDDAELRWLQAADQAC